MGDSFSNRVGGPKSSILEMLDADSGKVVPLSEGIVSSTLLPRAGDPYVAHSRQSNGPETTLYCIDHEGYFQGFAWSTFERIRLVRPETPGGGPVLVLRFSGSEVSEVAIEGGNLDNLRVFLGQCRVTWIRELGGGRPIKPGPDEPIITRITIQPMPR